MKVLRGTTLFIYQVKVTQEFYVSHSEQFLLISFFIFPYGKVQLKGDSS